MSSLPRREVAFPRGRPGPAPDPSIVPLYRPDLPFPIWQRGVLYILAGRPVQWVAERWKSSDVWACPTASEPDPERPGQHVSVRMVDGTTSTVIPPLDRRRLAAALSGLAINDYRRVASGQSPTFASPRRGPQPTRAWHVAYSIEGRTFTFIGERWRLGEEHASLSACFPDSEREGVMLTTRLLGPDGEIVTPVSCDEFAAAIPPISPLPSRTLRVSGR